MGTNILDTLLSKNLLKWGKKYYPPYIWREKHIFLLHITHPLLYFIQKVIRDAVCYIRANNTWFVQQTK